MQNNLKIGRNDLTFGSNARIVRFVADEANNDLFFTEPDITKYLYAAFVQDTINLHPKLDLTIGTIAEAWTLVDDKVRFSPSARLLFRPVKGMSLWSAFSRSITTPGYIQTKMELHLAEIPYVTPEMAAYLADQYGLTGEERDQFIAENTTSPLFLPGSDRLFVSVVNGDDVKPMEYYTGEVGWRSSLGPRAYLDFSAFYAKFDNGITTDLDFQSKPPIYSDIDPSHSIWPVYYNNMYEGYLHGWETVFRTQPASDLRLELSHSLFKIVQKGLPIPGQPGEFYNLDTGPYPATPIHVVRIRPYLDIPKIGLYMTLNVLWHSAFNPGEMYNYQMQMAASEAEGIPGIWPTAPTNRWKVDFSIEKTLSDRHWRLNFWGRNVFADQYVETYTQYIGIGYPHAVHRTFGGGRSFHY